MPSYLSDWQIWMVIWPLAATAIGSAFLLSLVIGFFDPPRLGYLKAVLVVASFAMVGMVAGYMTGNSRESAVGAVLPGILALIGAINVYIVGTKEKLQLLSSVCVLAMAANLLLGSFWGANVRNKFDQWQANQMIMEEEILHRVALSRLEHEVLYARLKKDLEAKWSITLPPRAAHK